MKYAILIPDGCADEPIAELGGKTPLHYANLPHLDALARRGRVGRSLNVPAHLPPGSDVATLALLGYNPSEVYTGRAPLEAAAMGIEMQPTDWAFRCNTVTIRDGMMESFTADHISSEEAAELVAAVQEKLPAMLGLPIRFYPGVSYRNLMLWSGSPPFTAETRTYPPHDYTGQSILSVLPEGPGSDLIHLIATATRDLLADHPVNKSRVAAGKLPCTHFWLWGQGKRPNMETFAKRFGPSAGKPDFSGAMITAVDLLRGIAKYLGWDILQVPGATGYVDTDYAAKGRHAAEALRTHDLVCVHVEAPDESGHEGDFSKKIKSLEAIDTLLLPPLLEALENSSEGWRLLVSPDHPTPCRLKTHTHGAVPWLWAGSNVQADAATSYDESTAEASSLFFADGYRMMERLIDPEPIT